MGGSVGYCMKGSVDLIVSHATGNSSALMYSVTNKINVGGRQEGREDVRGRKNGKKSKKGIEGQSRDKAKR